MPDCYRSFFKKTRWVWHVGVDFMSLLLLGTLFGIGMDNFFPIKPWGLIIFTLFGGGAGFYHIFKKVSSFFSVTQSTCKIRRLYK